METMMFKTKIAEILGLRTADLFIRLPRKHTRQLSWSTEDRFEFYLDEKEKLIKLVRSNEGTTTMEKGRYIGLPDDFCESLGWGKRDKLKVEKNAEEDAIIFTMHKKLKLKCKDCRTTEGVKLVNYSCFQEVSKDFGICRACELSRRRRFEAIISETIAKMA